ncbi:MAG: replication initiation factor domain-containing protein [Chloroflexota bacterium]
MYNKVFSFDYFSVTVWDVVGESASPIEHVCQLLGFTGWSPLKNGSRGYMFRQSGIEGANLYTKVRDTSHGSHNHLELKGSACAMVSPERFKKLFRWFIENNIKYRITRLDLAIDHQAWKVSTLWCACQDGDIKTRVRRSSIRRVHDLELTGDTVYIGSRQSDKMIRAYKKQVPQHPVFGDNHFTRVEMVLKGDIASAMWVSILESPVASWLRYAVSAINEYFTVHKNWWVNWCGDVLDGVLFRKQSEPMSIKKTANWLYTQVSASLAMYIDAMSLDNYDAMLQEINDLLQHGYEKMTSEHKAVSAHFKKAINNGWDGNKYDVLFPDPKSQGEIDAMRKHYTRNLVPSWLRKVLNTHYPGWVSSFATIHDVERIYTSQGVVYSIDWERVERKAMLSLEPEPLPQNELPTQKSLLEWAGFTAINDTSDKSLNHYEL